jgi:hypothetical protein
MNEIRQLVENYYDIQKIRVETFNRIVMFIKENEKKIIEALSHKLSEIQVSSVSQYENGTQPIFASHFKTEIQHQSASQSSFETHLKYALKLLEEKKYAEFVKKYVISHKNGETQSESASQEEDETQSSAASQCDAETHYDGASQLKGETHNFVALSPFIKQIENLTWFHNKLYETEKELYKRLDAWSRNHPLRTEYLNYVKGIGPVLASGIIAWLEEPIKKASHVSQIWSYCGLAPNQVRKAGEKVNYNPRLKTFAWKIGQSFIKFKCFGRKLYNSFKEQAKQKHPDWTKLHIHNYARKKVVKLFIASVWEVWRKMNNLPTTKPYPIEFLGHKDIITPDMWVERKVVKYEV